MKQPTTFKHPDNKMNLYYDRRVYTLVILIYTTTTFLLVLLPFLCYGFDLFLDSLPVLDELIRCIIILKDYLMSWSDTTKSSSKPNTFLEIFPTSCQLPWFMHTSSSHQSQVIAIFVQVYHFFILKQYPLKISNMSMASQPPPIFKVEVCSWASFFSWPTKSGESQARY